jgi:hypothetical protein
MAKIGVEWGKTNQTLQRRYDEAALLESVFCSRDTTNLANEFAKCENARVMLADTAMIRWLKTFERTLVEVAQHTARATGALTAGAISHGAMVVCLLTCCLVFGNHAHRVLDVISGTKHSAYSAVATARIAAGCLDIEDKKFI